MFDGDLELLNDFVVESNEGMAEIESDLLAIEAGGAEIDADLVNKVFRAIHSIKGAAGFLSLKRIESLSHSAENVLSQIRNRALVPTSAIVDRLLKASDVLRRMINDIHKSNEYDVSEHVSALKAILGEGPAAEAHGSAAPPVATPAASAPPANISPATATSPAAASSPVTTAAVAGAVSDAAELVITPEEVAEHSVGGQAIVRLTFLPGDRETKNFKNLVTRLGDAGTIIRSSVPELLEKPQPQPLDQPFTLVYATVLGLERTATFFGIPADRVTPYAAKPSAGLPVPAAAAPPVAVSAPVAATSPVPVIAAPAPAPVMAEAPPTANAPTPASAPTIPPAAAESGSPASAKKPAADDTAERKAPPQAETNIRVSVAVLDRLMNLAGELVLGRNQLLQTLSTGDRRLLESVGSRIDQITTELQETIMQTRMQPVGTVFSKFTRVVRDLSKQLGKEVQLEIDGKDVELDKSIIEAIGDPLTHLIRNSMDHGIEMPDVRTERGKPATGTIRLTATHQEGKVVILIRDDGAGIDAARLRKKAVEKGVITQDVADSLSEREAVRLIFAPGFSTAEKVTAVSGRGVGMDVVRTNVEKLGGQIEIDTIVGKGTDITIRLPLTLAIIPCLIASSHDERYAIPQSNISELVRVRGEELTRRIGKVHHSEVLRLRGSLLPLIRLNSLTARAQRIEDMPIAVAAPSTDGAVDTQATATAPAPEIMNIVVIETGRLRYGLVVDRLHDSEEIVVKPLGRHLATIPFLSGATVLGDGRIALILNLAGVATHRQLNAAEDAVAKFGAADANARQHESMSTLLFTNHPQEQFGIPMSVVTRIERIVAEQIDTVAHQEVLQYRGATLPLLRLENCIRARGAPQQARYYVVVFRHAEREYGLIVPDVLDIRELSTDMDTTTFREPGVLSSILIDGHTVRVLDLYELGQAHDPATGYEAPVHESAVVHNERPRILLAEDSSFFRNKVVGFLEEQGWEVVACVDGLDAWNTITKSAELFDLVITDIEMPKMNGFELCEHIRSRPEWAELPVIAVTSLAGDADRAHGILSGATEYIVKLDRDLLLRTVGKYIAIPAR